jgi:hypothetical protein
VRDTLKDISITLLPKMNLLNETEKRFMFCTSWLDHHFERSCVTDNTRQKVDQRCNFLTVLDEVASLGKQLSAELEKLRRISS